jgi:CBS domain containing-hemolysin-like protein
VSAPWSPVAIALGLGAAAALFLLDLVLSTILQSVASLSRVALRRLSNESETALLYLEDIKKLTSTYRAALQAARQASLLGGTILVAITAKGAGWPYPWLLGTLAGTGIGIALFETLLSRSLALRDPKAALRSTAFLARPLHAVAYPLLRLLDPMLRASERSGEAGEEEDEADADEEVEAFIEVGEREGILEESEGEMVRGIVDLGETSVREIMVPRTDIFAFPSDMTVAEARRGFLKSTHARVAVYRDTIDEIVGILHVRDLLKPWEAGLDADPVSAYVRPAFFVPETRPVAELLAEMRRGHHIAIVVDEYGGVAGLVTLEDLLEEIVGDIRDEHTREEARLEQD